MEKWLLSLSASLTLVILEHHKVFPKGTGAAHSWHCRQPLPGVGRNSCRTPGNSLFWGCAGPFMPSWADPSAGWLMSSVSLRPLWAPVSSPKWTGASTFSAAVTSHRVFRKQKLIYHHTPLARCSFTLLSSVEGQRWGTVNKNKSLAMKWPWARFGSPTGSQDQPHGVAHVDSGLVTLSDQVDHQPCGLPPGLGVMWTWGPNPVHGLPLTFENFKFDFNCFDQTSLCRQLIWNHYVAVNLEAQQLGV